MKNTIKSIFAVTLVLAAFAFTNPITKKVDVKESSIEWMGKKVVGNSHSGTLTLKSGYIEMEGTNMTGGEFVVDMTSINVTDPAEGKGKDRLEGHLKSEDFFGVEAHPEATLVIKSATKDGSNNIVVADLTIKGITEEVTFNLGKEGNTVTTRLVFDRSKFNVRYGSGSFFDDLGDKAISDDITLDVMLKF